MGHYRHSKDKDGSCSTMGGKAEDLFRITMANRGHEITPTEKELQIKHVDFILDKKTKVEVKSAKRIARGDSSSNDQFIWVEISSVYHKEGKHGWLYGQADVIAFENGDNFIFVRRVDLVALVETICDLKTFVKKPADALHKSYRRWDRPTEHVTLINVSDLDRIEHKKIPKMLSPEGSYYLVARNDEKENFQEISQKWSLDFEEMQKQRDAVLPNFKEVVIKKRNRE